MARFQIDTALGDPSCGGRSGWLNRPQTERCWPQVAAWRILGPTTSAVTASPTSPVAAAKNIFWQISGGYGRFAFP
jgi:hypothetical protein